MRNKAPATLVAAAIVKVPLPLLSPPAAAIVVVLVEVLLAVVCSLGRLDRTSHRCAGSSVIIWLWCGIRGCCRGSRRRGVNRCFSGRGC